MGRLLSALTRQLPADDGDPEQRQGRRLLAFYGLARRRPLCRAVPRRRASRRCLRSDAAHGQRESAQVRRPAAFPRAHRLYGPVPAFIAGGAALQGGYRLRARGVQSRRGDGERAARRHGRLRVDRPAAPPGFLAAGDAPVPTLAPSPGPGPRPGKSWLSLPSIATP